MKFAPFTIGVVLASFVLAGCSSGLLNRKSTVPQAANVPTNGSLTMPPDLQLAAPGTATYRAPQPDVTSDGIYDTVSANPGTARRSTGQARQNCPSGAITADVYECYGIAKVKTDGKAKTDAELKAELKVALLAEKRRTNPGYGTFKNIGAIFRDE